MVFNSLSFLIFLPIVLIGYYLIPLKGKTLWLLAASYVFYGSWNARYLVLILFSTLVTYGCGILLEKTQAVSAKKAILTLTILANLGLLVFFKYFDFLLDNLNRILTPAGMSTIQNPFSFLLPVGISFYTFQVIGYVVDVYRGTIPAEKNLPRYALFVSFFPQLVAGPIERSSNLLGQLRDMEKTTIKNSLMTRENVIEGAFTVLYGFLMKMILADRIAILVNTVFDPASADVEDPIIYAGFSVLVAALLFSVQIYCDFAGYTYIAIGCARMMGIRLRRNFDVPYMSLGIRDFWDRWHMSLTSWFRDYLYFPLGGSRKGAFRKYLNIMIVFLVSGLWHGASWHFVVWGGLHGVLRILEELTETVRRKFCSLIHYDRTTKSHRLLLSVLTFLVVTLCWIFFRAGSTSQALDLIHRMFSGFGLWQLTDGTLLSMGLDGKDWNVLLFFGAIMCLVDSWRKKGIPIQKRLASQNIWFQWLLLFFGILAIVIFGAYGSDYDASAFIYFQF